MEAPAKRIKKEDLKGIRPKLEPVASASSCGAGKISTPVNPNLPPPWTAHVSTRTGEPYWHNSDTKKTTWTCPVHPVITPQRPPLHNGAMAVGSSFPKASGAMEAPAQVAKRMKEEDLEENGKAHRDKEGHVIFVVDIRKEDIYS